MTIPQTFSLLDHVRKIENLINQKEMIQKIAKNFIFQEELTMQDNLKLLAETLIQAIQIEASSAQSLRAFLMETNLPIEVTLKPLRANHLADLLQDWLSHSSEGTFSNQRLYTITFRNSLFKTTFLEEQQTIEDYFSLNSNNMLIADDIFNLLQEILTPYFLYDNAGESRTFFEKENSLLLFKGITLNFATHDHRILFGQQENSRHIHRLQFQKLIEFWQSINPDLVLMNAARKCIKETSIQTNHHNYVDLQVQTSRAQLTFIDFLNSTLWTLNQATTSISSPKDLQTIERIHQFLKHEKDAFLALKPQNHIKQIQQKLKPTHEQVMTPKSQIYSQCQQGFSPNAYLVTFTPKQSSHAQWLRSQQRKMELKNLMLLSSKNTKKTAETTQSIARVSASPVKNIYDHYKIDDIFTLKTFQKCLYDMRLDYKCESDIGSSLIKKGIIKNILQVSLDEFTNGLTYISSINPTLNQAIISRFSINLSQAYKKGKSSRLNQSKYNQFKGPKISFDL